MTLSAGFRLVRGLLLWVPIALCAGCFKPAAQARADRLASEMRSAPGCAQTLRQWFAAVESAPRSDTALPIPESLESDWWRGARAHAAWSREGKLQRISVTRDGLSEPFVLIGSPGDTAVALGLTHKAGEPLAFYAEITNGIYACSSYYK